MSNVTNRDRSPAELIDAALSGFKPDSGSRQPLIVQQAVYLARILQTRAVELQTPQERRQQAELDRMIQSPQDKITLTQMTDQAFRAHRPDRAVDQLTHILDVQGIPRCFSPVDRTLLRGFQSFGSYLPGVAVPLVKEKMHKETANVILPAERELLNEHLDARRQEGVRMNVNFLGEALLGEREAQRRLQLYLEALQNRSIEVISVKISTIYSQISSLAHDHSVAVISDRMEHLYRDAGKTVFRRADGSTSPKFVYLDMEEYRDMSITLDVFMNTLDRHGLENVAAGIVLQAYIPESYDAQRRLLAWAEKRVANGGAPITLRIVKGANLEMERFEASIQGWPQAPFLNKIETDANYKRMLQLAMEGDHLHAVRLGIASHNLFDLSYGLVLAHTFKAFPYVQFEMLEGMANHVRRAIFEWCHNLLLYAPACSGEDFIHAIGYLIRRLDENTGAENFLRHAFKLEVGSETWNLLQRGFEKSFDHIDSLPGPRRTQDRRGPPRAVPYVDSLESFDNEPDTDFALSANVQWAQKIVNDWRAISDKESLFVPLVVDGVEISVDRRERDITDPSRPGKRLGKYALATPDDIDRAVQSGRDDTDDWRTLTPRKRGEYLAQAAYQLRLARAELMGAALANGGKLLTESDPEVSEAVDFVEFYRRSASAFFQLPTVDATPRGVVVVVSPWNFPIAIPCGGIAAALAAGNSVILKPSSDAVLPAYRVCRCFWDAGVSRKTLQFLPCSGSREGQQLVAHDDVDTVILTGGTDTAISMLTRKPSTRLLAETGGKNATIVTALADRDQAIKHILHSAFSHSGQKCSATSLLLLEKEVYEDESFRQTLCDAVESMRVGSAWELESRIGPLIGPPGGALEKSLMELEEGESWAVLPRKVAENPNLYSPAVKWGTQPGSFTHMTEFFGPVLAVMGFDRLAEAIAIVNETGYGLTSGLESLDDREQQEWLEGIRAGNLYINRSTTGAIVLRQPFGGMGKSAFGPGIKAGGPNNVAQLIHFRDKQRADLDSTFDIANSDLAQLKESIESNLHGHGPDGTIFSSEEVAAVAGAIGSIDVNMREEFGKSHDFFRLIGQDNFRRYLPVAAIRIRVQPADSVFETFTRVAAAKAAGCHITISSQPGLESPMIDFLDRFTYDWAADIEFVEETDDELAEAIRAGQTDRVRFAGRSTGLDRVSDVVRRAAASAGVYIADAPVLAEGRIELLWYFAEQSVSIDYHRYGNLGSRSDEPRRPSI